jgi:phosphotriesterase-related protein
MPIIRTVLGDIAPDALGLCLPHEHIYGQPPPEYAEPDLMINDEALGIAEMQAFHAAGGRAIVEMTTPDYGRDAGALQRISRASGVHIIAATGHNKEKFSAPWLTDSVETLSERFVREVTEGMDGTDARAGVIKASSTLNEISPLAEKLFRAAALAHHRTGAPISTHTEAGTMALEQVALLMAESVVPRAIIIGHVDRRLEVDYHLRLAATGVYLSYDQVGKAKYYPDAERAEVIRTLIEAGHGAQILLAGDTARRSGWKLNGGRGFAYIPQVFTGLLRERGISEAQMDALLRGNPARALAFEPI